MTATAQPNAGVVQGWASQENGWGDAMNANLRLLDLLVQARVADKDLATPPGSPAAGDAYLVAASPTGAWVGHATHIARWSGSAWEFYTPKSGWLIWVADESKTYRFNGTAWAAFAITIAEVTGLQAALDAKAPAVVAVTNKTTSYTLEAGDAGGCVRVNASTATMITVPGNGTTPFAIGTTIAVRQVGAGTVSFTSSATINTPTGFVASTGRQGATVMLHKVGTDEWDLTGDLKAA